MSYYNRDTDLGQYGTAMIPEWLKAKRCDCIAPEICKRCGACHRCGKDIYG